MFRRIKRSLAHRPVNGEPHLRPRLVHFDWLGPPLPAEIIHQLVGVFDCVLSALDRYISHLATIPASTVKPLLNLFPLRARGARQT